MTSFLRAVGLWLTVGLVAGLLPAQAAAYVPLPEHLLALAADRRDDPPPSAVHQIRTSIASAAQHKSPQYDEVVYLRFPGAFRSEMETENGRRVTLDEGGRHWVADAGALSSPKPEPLDLALRILVQNRAEGLAQVLAAQGVNLAVTSLGLFDGRIGFVLGARYPEESVPQLWFDRETLLPFRWLMVQQTPDGSLHRTEIRYFAWKKQGGLLFPEAMACYRDGQLASEVRVEKVVSPAKVPDSLFSPERLIERFAPGEMPPQGG